MEPAISLVEPTADIPAAMRAIGVQARQAARILANAPAKAKTDALLAAGREVVIYDNFRTGHRQFIADAVSRGAVLVEGDVLDLETLTAAMRGCDTVIHLAANADVRLSRRGRGLAATPRSAAAARGRWYPCFAPGVPGFTRFFVLGSIHFTIFCFTR